jgi:3-oxoacyl-[acyl-carrier protein] reductase
MDREENIETKSNKVALVTGSSRGIGYAIAIEFAKRNIDVVINNHEHPIEGQKVSDEIRDMGRRSLYIQADVSNFQQVEEMIKKITSEFGRIDILVNNAGIKRDKLLEKMDNDQWNSVISVNLTGVFNCTKSVIKYMKMQGGGKIINISSIAGEIGNVGQANYAASKGGVISFTKTVAKEHTRNNILVNAIAPGFIETSMVKTIPEKVMDKILSKILLGRLGKPEEVAKLVCFLASDDANYITGQIININGGLYM